MGWFDLGWSSLWAFRNLCQKFRSSLPSFFEFFFSHVFIPLSTVLISYISRNSHYISLINSLFEECVPVSGIGNINMIKIVFNSDHADITYTVSFVEDGGCWDTLHHHSAMTLEGNSCLLASFSLPLLVPHTSYWLVVVFLFLLSPSPLLVRGIPSINPWYP